MSDISISGDTFKLLLVAALGAGGGTVGGIAADGDDAKIMQFEREETAQWNRLRTLEQQILRIECPNSSALRAPMVLDRPAFPGSQGNDRQ